MPHFQIPRQKTVKGLFTLQECVRYQDESMALIFNAFTMKRKILKIPFFVTFMLLLLMLP